MREEGREEEGRWRVTGAGTRKDDGGGQGVGERGSQKKTAVMKV